MKWNIISQDGFKDAEVYHRSPFKVEFDSLHPQILNVPVYLSCDDENNVKIKVSTESANTYVFKEGRNGGYVENLVFTKTVKWGDKVTTPYFSFRLKKLNNSVCDKGSIYYFKFRNPDNIANIFRSRLSVGANS